MKVTYPADYDGLEMNGTAVIQMLLNGSFNMLQERLEAMTDEEWGQRALPGTSKLGFILWHCARIIDWTVHCAFQGVPEVADRAEWRERFAPEACYGAGIPDALADRVVDAPEASGPTAIGVVVPSGIVTTSWPDCDDTDP